MKIMNLGVKIIICENQNRCPKIFFMIYFFNAKAVSRCGSWNISAADGVHKRARE